MVEVVGRRGRENKWKQKRELQKEEEDQQREADTSSS